MRKLLVVVGLVVALAIPATAFALVSLHEAHIGTSCPDGGYWHFVANGVDGKVGSLTVELNGNGVKDGANEVNLGKSLKFNKGTNHWVVDGPGGTLTGAWATEGTILVLSDYLCYEKKDK